MNDKISNKLVSEFSQKAGVSEADVAKVFKALGLEAVLSNVEDAAGVEKIGALSAGDLKLGVRLGRSSVSV
ncbi:hypothetical protein PRtIB026_A28940 [Pseudomonas sp. RtIB026]|jgi:hypothetical protein|uniref:hypothetical protein n=1 Tax=Pseudomonas sp. RtIB026 TaxID=2749999 RepID=UPI001943ADCA|nr:hypothetical protein [Pseudomonas sp. RtIB026]BCJ07383.1 hypothetical protein PRtIB026_A28940 [Pseudomonas sp. RtIB026]